MSTTQTQAKELQGLAQDILEYAASQDMSKAELLRSHPALGSDKTLAIIAAGKTDELDLDRWLTAYRAVTAEISPPDDEEADPLFEDLSTTKAVRHHFTRLKMSRTSAKLVIVEGQTGMGKTSAGKIITRKMRDLNPVASIFDIEASAGWGDRPNAMLAAMLKALGMPDSSRSQAARLDKLVDALNSRPAVFIIDEVHDVGVRCLRVVKTLLNLTSVKIILLTHPRLFRDLERENWDDVGQLTGNRLVARINLGAIDKDDVKIILTRRLPGLNGTATEAAKILANAANGHGNFAFIREVIVRLRKHQAKTKTEALTLADVDQHLRAELKARRSSSLLLA